LEGLARRSQPRLPLVASVLLSLQPRLDLVVLVVLSLQPLLGLVASVLRSQLGLLDSLLQPPPSEAQGGSERQRRLGLRLLQQEDLVSRQVRLGLRLLQQEDLVNRQLVRLVHQLLVLLEHLLPVRLERKPLGDLGHLNLQVRSGAEDSVGQVRRLARYTFKCSLSSSPLHCTHPRPEKYSIVTHAYAHAHTCTRALPLSNGRALRASMARPTRAPLRAGTWPLRTCRSTRIIPSRSFVCRITRQAERRRSLVPVDSARRRVGLEPLQLRPHLVVVRLGLPLQQEGFR